MVLTCKWGRHTKRASSTKIFSELQVLDFEPDISFDYLGLCFIIFVLLALPHIRGGYVLWSDFVHVITRSEFSHLLLQYMPGVERFQ